MSTGRDQAGAQAPSYDGCTPPRTKISSAAAESSRDNRLYRPAAEGRRAVEDARDARYARCVTIDMCAEATIG